MCVTYAIVVSWVEMTEGHVPPASPPSAGVDGPCGPPARRRKVSKMSNKNKDYRGFQGTPAGVFTEGTVRLGCPDLGADEAQNAWSEGYDELEGLVAFRTTPLFLPPSACFACGETAVEVGQDYCLFCGRFQ
jgi:hypothetical protein